MIDKEIDNLEKKLYMLKLHNEKLKKIDSKRVTINEYIKSYDSFSLRGIIDSFDKWEKGEIVESTFNSKLESKLLKKIKEEYLNLIKEHLDEIKEEETQIKNEIDKLLKS
jgi:CRISPR/Cas system-associated endoribonuclease Cas2